MQEKIMQFKLPPEFFVKVLKDYSDWRFAWIREVLQNSIDANSKNISITAIQLDTNQLLITVKDDGKGMNRDVLENGFMSLGGSVKDGEDAVGGFGVASMMIAQSHVSYTIRSHDYICKGQRGSYTVLDSDTFTTGCEIAVIMDKNTISQYSSPIGVMKNNLEKWASYADVKGININFNNEDISPKNRKFEYSFDTNIGKISFSDEKNGYGNSLIYVRMNKQPMFSVNVYNENAACFSGVLDLIGNSKDNLTSNRDGLLGEKSKYISNIILELSKERTKYMLGNMSQFKLNEVDMDEILENSNQEELYSLEREASRVTSKNKQKNAFEEESEPFQAIFKKEKNTFESLKDKINKKIESIKSQFFPFNFSIKYSNTNNDSPVKRLTSLIKMLNQKKYQKLAWNWKYIVDSLIDCMIEIEPYYFKKVGDLYFFQNKPINVGFVFHEYSEGMCSENDEEICFYINPDIAQDFDVSEIKDVAIHEVTHSLIKSHSETFSSEEIKLRRKWRKNFKYHDFRKNLKEKVLLSVK